MKNPRQVTVADRPEYRSEYAGGPGDNLVSPTGVPRRLSAAEQAREMRRAGLAEQYGPRDSSPEPRT